MIEHMHPRMEYIRDKKKGQSFQDLEHITKSISNVGLHPSDRVVQHFDKVVSYGGVSRNARGSLFEYFLYDAFVASGVRITHTNKDMGRGRNAEADLLCSNGVAVLAKTSVRERWKQPDRDAHIMEVNYRSLVTHIVFLREHEGDDLAYLTEQSIRIQSQLFSKATIFSVYQKSKFEDLIIQMGGEV